LTYIIIILLHIVCVLLAPCRKIHVAICASRIVAMLNKQMVHKSSSLMMT
jgi:hypothetical protein